MSTTTTTTITLSPNPVTPFDSAEVRMLTPEEMEVWDSMKPLPASPPSLKRQAEMPPPNPVFPPFKKAKKIIVISSDDESDDDGDDTDETDVMPPLSPVAVDGWRALAREKPSASVHEVLHNLLRVEAEDYRIECEQLKVQVKDAERLHRCSFAALIDINVELARAKEQLALYADKFKKMEDELAEAKARIGDLA
tara:strand:+ start:919 stop:1503 length:585 start_codon:yes stop_codon:yes gene_type:complete